MATGFFSITTEDGDHWINQEWKDTKKGKMYNRE